MREETARCQWSRRGSLSVARAGLGEMPWSSARCRLHAIAAQLSSGPVPAAAVHLDPSEQVGALPDTDARSTGLYSKPRLLTNAQMAGFLAQGFLSLPVDDVVSRPGFLPHF